MAQPVSEKADSDRRLRAIESAMAQFLREHPKPEPEVKESPERWLEPGEDPEDMSVHPHR